MNLELDVKYGELKAAHKEQDFHLKRSEDLLPTLKKAEETMASQESIIRSFEQQIKDVLKNKNKAEDYERKLQYKQMMHEKELLREKNNQLDTLYKIHEGILPKEVVSKLSKDPFLQQNNSELKFLKEQAGDLLQQVEHLSKTLEDVWIHNDVEAKVRMNDAYNQSGFERREKLKREIDRQNEQAQRLEIQMIEMSKNYSEKISELKNNVMLRNLEKSL